MLFPARWPQEGSCESSPDPTKKPTLFWRDRMPRKSHRSDDTDTDTDITNCKLLPPHFPLDFARWYTMFRALLSKVFIHRYEGVSLPLILIFCYLPARSCRTYPRNTTYVRAGIIMCYCTCTYQVGILVFLHLCWV